MLGVDLTAARSHLSKMTGDVKRVARMSSKQIGVQLGPFDDQGEAVQVERAQNPCSQRMLHAREPSI